MNDAVLLQLLEKYRQGNLLPEEETILNEWFAALQATANNWYTDKADEAAQLTALWQSIHEKTTVPVVPITRKRIPARYWWAAAVVTGILLISIWFIPNKPQEIAVVQPAPKKQTRSLPAARNLTVTASRRSVRKLVLPDNSVVLLNSGTSIQYPEKFDGRERKVTLLQGQAFFLVTKDSLHPFIVQSAALQTQVLGTSFEIAMHKGNHINVSVATGKVKVINDKLIEMGRLLPGKRLTWQEKTGKAFISNFKKAAIAQWRNKESLLEHASFAELADAFETIYGVQLKAADSLVQQQTYTITLQYNTGMKDMVEVLAAIHQNAYSIQQNTVTIKPKDP